LLKNESRRENKRGGPLRKRGLTSYFEKSLEGGGGGKAPPRSEGARKKGIKASLEGNSSFLRQQRKRATPTISRPSKRKKEKRRCLTGGRTHFRAKKRESKGR